MGDKEDLDPKDHAIRTFGHLWKAAKEAGKAAKEAANGIRKEVQRGSIGKAVDDAGREVVRAANNVADRLAHLGDEKKDEKKKDGDDAKKD